MSIIGNNSVIHNTFRAIGPILITSSLLISIIFWNKLALKFLISTIIVLLSIGILKEYIARPLYKLFGTFKKKGYYIPFFGRGNRPLYAKCCSSFVDCKELFASSFGMPSGHSILSTFFASYWITYIYNDKEFEKNKNKNYLKISILLLIALYSMYARIYIAKCHTFQQVLMGGLYGSIMGYYFEKYL